MPDSLDTWLARLERRHPVSIDLGLERCRKVWRHLGSPRPAGTVFTVAGTNGKGSTVAYIDQLLKSAGMTCGKYTSPHLLRFNERIVIRGHEVSSGDLVRAFEKVEAGLNGVSLTYFEFTTLAAFLIMAEAGLDCAVLEIGLGGRLDTVNLVDPDCSVMTPIGLDHQAYLGDTIEDISREKAGIMRAGIPVVCGDRAPSAVLKECAKQAGAEFFQLGEDFDFSVKSTHALLRVGEAVLRFPEPPLPGAHQKDNLATAMAAVETVFPGLLERRPESLASIAGTSLAGRLMRAGPGDSILVDVGHNPMAAAVVANYLRSGGTRRVRCVLGMLRDKDAAGVAQILSDRVLHWYCATLHGQRGRSGHDLAETLRCAVPGIMAEPHESVARALDAACADASLDDTVLVFGSFETAGQALVHLERITANTAASYRTIS